MGSKERQSKAQPPGNSAFGLVVRRMGSTWTWKATAPSTPGNSTVTVKLIDPFCGMWVSASASFTISQSPLPSSLSFDVASTTGWLSTSLKVTKEQNLSFSAKGAWTVDFRNFPQVGPDGYSLEVD